MHVVWVVHFCVVLGVRANELTKVVPCKCIKYTSSEHIIMLRCYCLDHCVAFLLLGTCLPSQSEPSPYPPPTHSSHILHNFAHTPPSCGCCFVWFGLASEFVFVLVFICVVSDAGYSTGFPWQGESKHDVTTQVLNPLPRPRPHPHHKQPVTLTPIV